MADETNITSVELQFEVVSYITRPQIKLDSEPRFLKSQGAIYLAEPHTGDDQDKQPPYLMDVLDVARKIEGQIIVNAIIHKRLDEKYPDNTYVGKTFRIAKTGVKDGKGGRKVGLFDIQEVRVKGDPSPVVAAPVPEAVAAHKTKK